MKTSASVSSYGYEDYDETVVVGGEEQVRKGPWTEEEDTVLANYISAHGEGHWNTLARSAGLRRTGKSCRLRWLNYLRPDVRRGNISLQEQLLILQLHSRWGNRWSKIAQELPGRTDNEIKNYWRTRVQKQAKQLRCDVNSQQFRDTMRYVWMPRLVERIQAASAAPYSVDTTQTAPEPNSSETSSWETQVSPVSDLTECSGGPAGNEPCLDGVVRWQEMEEGVMSSWDSMVWSEENVWFLQQQLSD